MSVHPSIPDLPLWVYFERDPSLGGIWVAHVLELDLITQGESLFEAFELAQDAATTLLADVIERDPTQLSELFEKRRAPQEDWDKLWTLFQRAAMQPIANILRSEADFSAMGTQIKVSAAAVFQRAFGQPEAEFEPFDGMPLGAAKCA